MLILFSLLAVFIAWVWVDYYRLIDIYHKDKLVVVIIVFILGALSTQLVTLMHLLFPRLMHLGLSDNLFTDFLSITFRIGLLEEIVKIIPLLLFLFFYRKAIKEPIDFIALGCIGALGFSAMENVLYFYNYGSQLIFGRSILSSIGHMCDTALIAYGIMRLFYGQKSIWKTIGFMAMGVVSHGFYDFWLMYKPADSYGWVLTLLYFMVCVSFFATILNNALNNSPFFSQKRVIDSSKNIASSDEVLWNYFAFGGNLPWIERRFQIAFLTIVFDALFSLAIIFICVIRLSRFTLIKGRWNKLKFELPFSIGKNDALISIKGQEFNEKYLTPLLEQQVRAYPVSAQYDEFGGNFEIYLMEKIHLQGKIYYQAEVLIGTNSDNRERVMLNPKLSGQTEVSEKYPVVGVMRMSTAGKYVFRGWVYLVPLKGES